MKKIIFYIFLILLFSRCTYKYNYKKICKANSKEYSFFLNGIAFNPYTLITNDAIIAIHKDRKQKIIHINYQYKPRIKSILHLLDSVNAAIKPDTISLVLVNGIPISSDNYTNMNIEVNSLDSIKVLKISSVFCKPQSSLLVISSKK